MELQYLKEFTTLAEVGNYQEASEQLYIAQSTLSRHILTIERELNTVLFNRTRKKVYLTVHGQKLLLYSNQLIRGWDELMIQIH